MKLKVYSEPRISAEVICEIDDISEVVIDLSESTEDFYKICTVFGLEGYCLKD